jgi:hypothetical protein
LAVTEAIFSPFAVTMAPFAVTTECPIFFVVSDFLKQKFLFADNVFIFFFKRKEEGPLGRLWEFFLRIIGPLAEAI